jgi:hypothetical protein
VTASICWIVALVLRGPLGKDGSARKKWPWFVAFAAFDILGGTFGFAYSEGTSSAYKNLDWHLKLALHHSSTRWRE